MPQQECPHFQANMDFCKCTYEGCARKGRCCECIQYHLRNQQLPACAFPAEVEKTFDRSFARFVKTSS